MKKYHVTVLFENGSHGFTFERATQISMESIIAKHEEKTKRLNNTSWARTLSIHEIKKDELGNDLRDENGDLIEELVYIDRKAIDALKNV